MRTTHIKRTSLTIMATLALALVFVTAPVASASAVTCRVISAQAALGAGGRTASQKLYVPGSDTSGCVDINVRNIQNTANANDHCATFNVQMFPTWQSETIYTAKKYVCSVDPDGSGSKDGPVVSLATNVKNGTEYRIWYDWESNVGGPRHTFQVVD